MNGLDRSMIRMYVVALVMIIAKTCVETLCHTVNEREERVRPVEDKLAVDTSGCRVPLAMQCQ